MPTNDDLTADLRTGVAALRQEFASLSAVSRSFGQDARRSLVGLETETRTATRGARDLGRVFTGALGDIASSGKSLKSVLQSLAVDLAKLATENLLGNGSGGANALTSLLNANANGTCCSRSIQMVWAVSQASRACGRGHSPLTPALSISPMRNQPESGANCWGAPG